MSVTLGELLDRGIATSLRGDRAVVVGDVQHDSRRVSAGDLFVAIPGQKVDGARFVADAIARGAAAVASEDDVQASVPTLRVESARRALALASHAAHGDPTAKLSCIGVTGTNGKTTTTWILDEALTAIGRKPSLIGTVETRGPGFREPSAFTTPEADEIARFADGMVKRGASHLVMEVSSHALSLHRADGIHFEVAAFTNLTQDHLDFHGTMEAYFEAKARLFTELAPRHAVIHVDDPMGAVLAERLDRARTRVLTVGRRNERAELRVTDWAMTRAGMRATLEQAGHDVIALESALVGAHNLENLLVAAGILRAIGASAREIEAALRGVRGAPGRLERVEDPRDVGVFVDYAHTPDALAKALEALRPITPGKLIVVFGCGGDRDRQKRPLMGAAAAARADLCVVTSDNPRTEEPRSIVDMILPGTASAKEALVEVDRRAAIGLALARASAGDTVLIAGKGHEDYQILGTTKIHFDDREEARAAIASITKGGA
ncbi:MAG: UDP-N-acetylmuramoyl-L-alanyl-D-glutamate--2,6-diaminopimelate ligase [Sandaracinus sp.]